MPREKFDLDRIIVTTKVKRLAKSDDEFTKFAVKCIKRYSRCDWGNVDLEDADINDEAVKLGNEYIFASYSNDKHPDWELWITTEQNHGRTKILFPCED